MPEDPPPVGTPSEHALPWGRSYLLCPPRFFDIAYEINPWMSKQIPPDPERAREQFETLWTTLQSAGADLQSLQPVEGLPDLVFTANAGIVDDTHFVPARFHHPERRDETPVVTDWFLGRGYEIHLLSPNGFQEGAGDALPVFRTEAEPVLLAGYRFRSDITTHENLSRILKVAVRSVELTDQRLYHLDLCFCPLDRRHAMVAPLGLDRYGMEVISNLVPEPILLEDEEALEFCANSVVVGSAIVMPSCPPRVGRMLEAIGFSIEVVDVSEFLKAGGGCRCLTLALDVVLH